MTGGMGLFKFVLSGAGVVVPGRGIEGVKIGEEEGASKMIIAPDELEVHDWVNGTPVLPQFVQAWFQGVQRVAWNP